MPLITARKRPQKETGTAFSARNEGITACPRLSLGVVKVRSNHRRSLLEAKMNGLKKFGRKVKAKAFERQVVKLNGRAAILHRFSQVA